MNTTSAKIAARLRTVRTSRKLTLNQIQELSGNTIGAIALGSYERGERGLSVARAIEIADFYEIPLTYLLTGEPDEIERAHRLVIDVRELRAIVKSSNGESSISKTIVVSFLAGIIRARQDFNGAVLSLREKDCDFLAMTLGCSTSELFELLTFEKMLITAKCSDSL